MTAHHPADHPVLEVDLDAIALNWRAVERAYSGTRIGAVVKRNAYGLGIERIVPWLFQLGCADFWVATLDEGVALRALLGARRARIFVLHGLGGVTPLTHAEHGLIPVLADLGELALARRVAAVRAMPLAVAVHLDTGLTRLGLDAAQVSALCQDPTAFAGLDLQAWVTQLGRFQDPDAPECIEQRTRFFEWTAELPPAERSLSTSSCVFADVRWHLDHARVGSALYGVKTAPANLQGFAPVATLRAPVLRVAEVAAGAEVGYGGVYRLPVSATLATLAIGYGDGLPIHLGDRGSVVLAGQTVPIVGGVSMGMITADVSTLPPGSVQPGDFAEIYGPNQRIHELASALGMAPSALLVPTADRARRTYRGSSVVELRSVDAA